MRDHSPQPGRSGNKVVWSVVAFSSEPNYILNMERTDTIVLLAARLRDKAYDFLRGELAERNIADLAPAHGEVIIALARHETLSLKALGAIIDRRKAFTTELVNRLVTLKYVRKVVDPQDHRSRRLTLTRKSLALSDDLKATSDALLERAYRNVLPADRQHLVDTLARVVANFQSESE